MVDWMAARPLLYTDWLAVAGMNAPRAQPPTCPGPGTPHKLHFSSIFNQLRHGLNLQTSLQWRFTILNPFWQPLSLSFPQTSRGSAGKLCAHRQSVV